MIRVLNFYLLVRETLTDKLFIVRFLKLQISITTIGFLLKILCIHYNIDTQVKERKSRMFLLNSWWCCLKGKVHTGAAAAVEAVVVVQCCRRGNRELTGY